MAASFGFSTGDFIAAIKLVATVIEALRESRGAGSEYREIVRQLYSLETALIRVKRLEVDPAQNAELIALRQAAAQYQLTIDNSWKKVQKSSASLCDKRSNQQARSLAGKVQDSYFGCDVSPIGALISVLTVNFKKVGHGLKLIERGDFVIQDSATKKDVNLEMEWDLCFSPGQRVEMSMLCKRPTRPINNCPTCKAYFGSSTEEYVECPNCELHVHRVLDFEKVRDYVSNINLTNGTSGLVKSTNMFGPSLYLPEGSPERNRDGNHKGIDEVSLFRRVRIYNDMRILLLLDSGRPDFNYEAKIFDIINNNWHDHTLIMWKDDNGTGIGLSFQNANRCVEIWQYVNDVLRHEYDMSAYYYNMPQKPRSCPTREHLRANLFNARRHAQNL
ncbi:hypothetical protein V491_04603 [Pseudogymnoascus sp. VKM F-3775]|nr:hypothetical protein V491_04603 [Pseudogymnoascus sp. VKM F-3775]